VTSWLHRVVVNACLDRLRAMRVRETERLPENLDRWSRLGSTMTKDPVVEGYSVEEAAELLDCAPGTVKSRWTRGRARLLPLLGHPKQAGAGS
jgi:RNA polymerase sigma-70 factor (ECF subfamily)